MGNSAVGRRVGSLGVSERGGAANYSQPGFFLRSEPPPVGGWVPAGPPRVLKRSLFPAPSSRKKMPDYPLRLAHFFHQRFAREVSVV